MENTIHEGNQHHKMNGQDRLRMIISAIASFLLSLALVGLTLLLVIQWSGFSRSSFYENMSANNYYDNVLNDIYGEAEAITLPIGLPVSVLDGVLTAIGISKDVNGYIDASFNNDTYVAQSDEVAAKLEENVRAYFAEAAISPNAEQEANLQAYIDSVVQIYDNTVKMPLLSSFIQARNLYKSIFTIGIVVCIIFALTCLVLILKLHSWLHRGLRFMAYATLATGLMTGIVPLFILQSGFYKRIHLSPEYFYNFFTDYVTNVLQSFLNFSAIWIVISTIIIAAVFALKKNRNLNHQ